MNALKQALDEIAGLPHDEECDTQRATSRGQPDESTPCTCHVGIAERALAAGQPDSEAAEHVVQVRPDEPGTLHFEPPLPVRRGQAIIDRMDVRNNADGSISVQVRTMNATLPRDEEGKVGVIVPPVRDPREVDGALLYAYRKLAGEAKLARKWSPTGMTPPDYAERRDEAAVALADDVLHRADRSGDVRISEGATLLDQLLDLVRSALYTLGNPISGLGGNTTAQSALRTLREAETLLDMGKGT